MLGRTANEILTDILSRLEGLDTRPSGVNYQSAAAIAYELKNVALLLDWGINQTFLKTATEENLDILAEQFKFLRKEPQKAIVKAEIITNEVVPIGNRFASVGLNDSIIYKVIEEIETNKYYLEAETIKPQVNYYLGNLAVIDYIPNVRSAKIIELTLPQVEQETDEEFRQRIQENLIAEPSDGNVAQFKKWLSEIKGVGKNKITSLWNGPNTVKCTILNEINQKASTELIKQVQDILDPNSTGLGEGLAPIGSIVTVDTATELKINITAEVEFKQGSTSAPTLEQELKDYFGEVAFNRNAVSFLDVSGVLSKNKNIDFITDLTINGGKKNITLETNQIPVLGVLNVN